MNDVTARNEVGCVCLRILLHVLNWWWNTD